MSSRPENIVIFDFDGTIVSKNTGSEFYQWMARKSLLRVILLTLMLPVLVPLRLFAFFTNNPQSQKLGLNIVCLISTAFPETPLFDLRKNFINYYLTRGNARVHTQAMEKIRQHQLQGDHVVIISGCPEWILHGIAKRIGIRGATLIGSKVSFSWKGFLLSDHCHQANKITMAKARGIDLSHCIYGYSDSITDAPLLRFCEHITLVNFKTPEMWYWRCVMRLPARFERWQ